MPHDRVQPHVNLGFPQLLLHELLELHGIEGVFLDAKDGLDQLRREQPLDVLRRFFQRQRRSAGTGWRNAAP